MSCPSQLRLDEMLAERASAELDAHLTDCASCRARLEQLRVERDDFRRRVRPAAFAEAVLARRRPARWPWLTLVATACALLLFVRLRRPEVVDDGYKGGAPDARLFVRHEGAVAGWDASRRYVAGDVLQVIVLSPRPIYAAVVDVEEQGRQTVLFNAEHALPAGRNPLPRSFELDGWRGGERLVVLFAEAPIADPIDRASRGEGRSFPILRP